MLAVRCLPVTLTVLACVLLVCAPGAVAAPAPPSATEAALAQERYLSSFGSDAGAASSSPEERYYFSYGEPEPVAAPPAPEPSAWRTPWAVLGAAIAAAGTLVLLALRRRGAGSPHPADAPAVGALLSGGSRHLPRG